MGSDNILPITLAIPTMNRPQTLKRTLESYLAADFLPAQIIVVDQSQDKENQEKNKEQCALINKTECLYIYQQLPSSTLARNTSLR